jgi:hypothetical protein
MLMMRPLSASRCAASWQPYSVPLMFTAMTVSICLSVASVIGVIPLRSAGDDCDLAGEQRRVSVGRPLLVPLA